MMCDGRLVDVDVGRGRGREKVAVSAQNVEEGG
jgi:hypothetical protein